MSAESGRARRDELGEFMREYRRLNDKMQAARRKLESLKALAARLAGGADALYARCERLSALASGQAKADLDRAMRDLEYWSDFDDQIDLTIKSVF